MTTQPQAGVALSGQATPAPDNTSGPMPVAPTQFDPSTWVIPTGIRGIWYHVKRSFNKDAKLKHQDHLAWRDWQLQAQAAEADWEQRCAQEQEALSERNAILERKFKEESIRLMMNLGVLPIIAFANYKSGSKTTLAANVGSMMALHGKRNSVLLPSTASPGSGASGQITGLIGDHLTLTEFAKRLGEFAWPVDLSKRLAKNQHGLSVVVEEIDEDPNGEPFTPTEYRSVLLKTRRLSDGCVLQDLGNDSILIGTIPVDAVRACDIVVFVASNTQPHSHLKMERTINQYKKDPYKGLSEYDMDGDTLPGERRSTAAKIREAFVVINGVKDSDEPYDFEKLRIPPNYDIDQEAPATMEGPGFNIPWDANVYGDHNTLISVDLERINQATYDAYLDLTVALLRKGAEVLGVSLGSLPEFTPEEFTPPAMEEIAPPTYESNRSS